MLKRAFFIIAVVAAFSFQSAPTIKYQPAMLPGGDPVNFTLVDTAGNKVSLSDFRGKFVVIDFWATWCAPCQEELPSTQKLLQDMAGNDKVVFIFVSFDKDEEMWKQRIEDDGLTGVNLIAGDKKEELKSIFGLEGIPHYTWINSKGVIVAKDAMHPTDFGVKAALKGYMMKD
jgi:thiol-disulfide isomerase/thioredoxin